MSTDLDDLIKEWVPLLEILKTTRGNLEDILYGPLARGLLERFNDGNKLLRNPVVVVKLKLQLANTFLTEDQLTVYKLSRDQIGCQSQFRNYCRDRVNSIWRKVLKVAYKMV